MAENEKSTAHKFDSIARIYNTPIFQLYYLWAHRACINFLKNNVKDDFKILDIACGTGIFLKKIKQVKTNLQLFGIDNSEKMIATAEQYSNKINFKVSGAEKIPFEDNSFDLITIIDAFYYFQDKEAVLKECGRTLKTDGHLFIFYPANDLFPKFILNQIWAASKFLFFNLEEYSEFLKVNEVKKMANTANLELVFKKNKLMHRFILFKKMQNFKNYA